MNSGSEAVLCVCSSESCLRFKLVFLMFMSVEAQVRECWLTTRNFGICPLKCEFSHDVRRLFFLYQQCFSCVSYKAIKIFQI